MKKIYFFTLTLISFTLTFASPKIQVASNGLWSYNASWDLNRLPSNGDTIVIPSNTYLKVAEDVNLSNVHLRIYGAIYLVNSNTQINLVGESDIVVYIGGSIQGDLASQKIRIGGVLIYQGNFAAIAGPATATATSNGFHSYILPVKFIDYSVNSKGNDVLVQWKTTEEINAWKYELERSFDATNWSSVASISALRNNSGINSYSFLDKNTGSKILYYRVKQIDLDGKSIYTSIKTIKADGNKIEVKIAAIQNKILLQFTQEIKEALVVRFISLNGQVIEQQTINQAVGQIILTTNKKGNYIVSLSNGQDINIAKQIIL